MISITSGCNGQPGSRRAVIIRDKAHENERWSLKKRARSEKMLPITAPICGSEINGEVELTPPISNSAEVQQNLTKESIVDINRYLRWADKAMESHPTEKEDRKNPCSFTGSVREIAMEAMHLRIEVAGLPVNDYQIIDGNHLEFRTLDSNVRPLPDQWGAWRRLTASELVLHFRLKTVVAHWFLQKTAEWDSSAIQKEPLKAA